MRKVDFIFQEVGDPPVVMQIAVILEKKIVNTRKKNISESKKPQILGGIFPKRGKTQIWPNRIFVGVG